MPTLFSQIIAGEMPSYKLYENEHVYAFLDIYPNTPGHTLIVPKIEIDHFYEVPEPYYTAVFQAAKLLSPALRKAMNTERVGVMIAGFEIPHFHLKLIPMNEASDMDSGKAKPADFAELKAIQENILSYL